MAADRDMLEKMQRLTKLLIETNERTVELQAMVVEEMAISALLLSACSASLFTNQDREGVAFRLREVWPASSSGLKSTETRESLTARMPRFASYLTVIEKASGTALL